MNSEHSYGKLKILFINIFAILYKATALNIYRLHADLRDAKLLINSSKQEVWIRELFIFMISSLILLRFVMCFVGLASNIVAIYPLLTNTQGELLMPTIIVQSVDNVVLNIYEMILGYCSMRFLHPQSMAVFAVFVTKLVVKTTCCISALNAYSDQYHDLTSSCDDDDTKSQSSEEFEIAHQSLI